MIPLNLTTQAYDFQMTEGKINPKPAENQGSLAGNAQKTVYNIGQVVNRLKSHSREETREAFAMLGNYLQAISQAIRGDKQAAGVSQKIDEATKLIKKFK